MKTMLFVFGLAFVITVLIANVDALCCWYGVEGSYEPQNCDELAKRTDDEFGKPRGTTKGNECATIVVTNGRGETADAKGCLVGYECGGSFHQPGRPELGRISFQCTTRCNTDYCNGESPASGPGCGAMTSIPPVSLLIMVIVSAIAAVGI